MLSPGDVLVLFAMPEEAQKVFDSCGARVRFSGIGKINATYAITRAIHEARPRLIVNFGTAGSPSFATRELVECTRFVQRDIDLSPLGFAKGTTPFDPTPAVLGSVRRFHDLAEGVCGTGDNFETTLPAIAGVAPVALEPHPALIPTPNVIEMEAYAIAKVCHFEKIPLACVKYITDGSDENASGDWASNLPLAAARFREVFERILKLDL